MPAQVLARETVVARAEALPTLVSWPATQAPAARRGETDDSARPASRQAMVAQPFFSEQVDPQMRLAHAVRHRLGRRAIRRSTACWFIGNSDLAQVRRAASNMMMRSMPLLMPPCGGAPYWKARYSRQKRSITVSSRHSRRSKAFTIASGLWLRMPPEAARITVAGDVVLERLERSQVLLGQRLQAALRHREGLCEKSTFFSSSLYSNIGKSTIQAKA